MAKTNALGKGIEALMKSAHSDIKENTPLLLDPRSLQPNPYQPRKEFNMESLEELADSIKTHGIIQPVVVEKSGNDSYFIIAGERRTRAAILAGLKEIPVFVSEIKDEVKLEVALIENIQRENLNPIEEASAYQEIIELGNLSQEELSKRVGKSRSAIANALRLLNLSEQMQASLKKGEISAGHARALLSIDNDEIRRNLFFSIINRKLSVREAEHEASLLNKKEKSLKPKALPRDPDNQFELRDIEQQFISELGTKVVIKGSMEKGSIEISYFSKEDLTHLYNKIKSEK